LAISGVGASSSAPAFLPLQPSGGGDFAASLRSQVRAEVARAIADELGGGDRLAANSARAAALQQSLTYQGAAPVAAAPAPSGRWADTARSIGGQYLSAQAADVFTRQMALESGNFDPDVISGKKVSAAGAQGIAQLMPASYPGVDRLDPVASLHAAAATMGTNLQRYGGDMRKALAAYNAGAGTVDDLVGRLGARWESGLPAETRRYLQMLAGPGSAR